MKLVAIVAIALLASCAAPAPIGSPSPSTSARAARLDLGRALARHPFTPLLKQYAADIAALQRAARDPAFEDLHGSLDASVADVNRRLSTAAAQLRDLHPRSIVLSPNGLGSRRDFSTGEAGAFQQAAQERVSRAVELRASQFREHEATVAFDFERAHAGRRLVLGVKLRDLHLDAATRHRYQAEVDELSRQESTLVDAERSRDAAILAGFAAQLRAQMRADSASLAADLTSHQRAMRDLPEPRTQTLPSSLLHPKDDATATGAAFAAARHDLTARLLTLRAGDDSANAGVRDEIANLERERDGLRDEIVASIVARAARIAANQHLGRLYTSGAPNSARDITGDVLRSY